MVVSRTKEMEDWVKEWPVGSKGLLGGRVKYHVTVEAIEWERGFPTLRFREDGTGHTYYCKFGWRRDLEHRVEAGEYAGFLEE